MTRRAGSLLWAAVTVVSLVVAGCSDSGSSEPDFVATPVLMPNPNPSVPLAAVVRSVTDEPAVIRLMIDDGEDTRVVTPDDTPRTDHETPVLGLHPAHEYTVRVEAVDGDGDVTDTAEDLTLTTPALPTEFAPITVTQPAVEGVSEPGVTLFAARFTPESASEAQSYLVMLDAEGEVVWYYDAGVGIGDSRRLRNGNLVFLHSGNRGMREIDMLGDTVAEWTATGHDDALTDGAVPVDTDSFHHEIYELPDGDEADFLALSSELRTYTDYLADEADPSETEAEVQVLGDVVVAFRRDGTVVQEWSLLDILDPYRVSYDSLGTMWQIVYEGEDTRDWSHGNAVVVDPADGGLVVSLRNQDAVVKIARDSGEPEWILGPPGRWEAPWSEALLMPADSPSGDGGSDFEWSYHQHAPMFTPDGGLLIFDNGNARTVPPDEELAPADRYSRVVEYRIDEEARTVTQTWSYGGPDEPWYSGALGDADYLPETGNVLVTDGFRATDDEQRFARVFEVTRDDPAQVVWEVVVRDETNDPPVDWTIYRAERLPSVYP